MDPKKNWKFPQNVRAILQSKLSRDRSAISSGEALSPVQWHRENCLSQNFSRMDCGQNYQAHKVPVTDQSVLELPISENPLELMIHLESSKKFHSGSIISILLLFSKQVSEDLNAQFRSSTERHDAINIKVRPTTRISITYLYVKPKIPNQNFIYLALPSIRY